MNKQWLPYPLFRSKSWISPSDKQLWSTNHFWLQVQKVGSREDWSSGTTLTNNSFFNFFFILFFYILFLDFWTQRERENKKTQQNKRVKDKGKKHRQQRERVFVFFFFFFIYIYLFVFFFDFFYLGKISLFAVYCWTQAARSERGREEEVLLIPFIHSFSFSFSIFSDLQYSSILKNSWGLGKEREEKIWVPAVWTSENEYDASPQEHYFRPFFRFWSCNPPFNHASVLILSPLFQSVGNLYIAFIVSAISLFLVFDSMFITYSD